MIKHVPYPPNGTATYNSSGTYVINQQPMTTTNTGTLSNAAWPTPGNINIAGSNPTICTDRNVIDLDELADMMKIMRERLLMLVPAFEKHEKYEALKKAYDHYKLIEAMIREDKHG